MSATSLALRSLLVTLMRNLSTLGVCMIMGDVEMGLLLYIPVCLLTTHPHSHPREIGLKTFHTGYLPCLLNLLHLPDNLWPTFPLTKGPLLLTH